MDDPAFQTPSLDLNVQTILLYASNHDLVALKPLLRIPGNASVQDPETGFTPLHAAIAACGPVSQSNTSPSTAENPQSLEYIEGDAGESDAVDIQKAKDVVKELFLSGAIWNDLDLAGETPGCLAWRLGQRELYTLVVEAGVRAEMLLGLMGGYEELESGGDEDEDVEVVEGMDIQNGEGSTTNGHADAETDTREEVGPKRDVNSEDYLKSTLQFEEGKLLDEDSNGVMMAWETNIMRRSVDLLLPDNKPGARILNVGFGMGIIDRMFRDTSPLSHHIIEAHPAVLSKIAEDGSDFGAAWESSAPEGGKYVVHSGRWQEIVPKLLEAGEVFDCIYFDTFGEDYSQLKLFFSEFVVDLLSPDGRFGFFNGLGADREVCYDVYSRVVELDLCEAGMDVEFTNVPVDVEGLGLGTDGEGEWKGVRRRYFAVGEYRLPVCTFMG